MNFTAQKPTKICCAGEVMIELAKVPNSDPPIFQQGIAGDTYNTAVYLARAGFELEYLSRLGDDAFSNQIIEQLHAESIGSQLIKQESNQQPGLYTIQNDESGERYFSYWRSQSPARRTFDTLDDLDTLYKRCSFDVFYFSGITMAVTLSGHENLLQLLQNLKSSGCTIMFDPNFRPKLWQDQKQAQKHYHNVLQFCDWVLPTLDDDALLWDIHTLENCEAHYKSFGVKELVIKAPKLVAHAYHYAEKVEYTTKQATAIKAIDTTGAGDAFNAGYIASRLAGHTLESAINGAQELSAKVVAHRGAILPS